MHLMRLTPDEQPNAINMLVPLLKANDQPAVISLAETGESFGPNPILTRSIGGSEGSID